MNAVEAAHRLGVHETQVVSVVEHAAGHVVRLRTGPPMLISATVARVFVPEVDDVPKPRPEVKAVEKPKKAAPKGRAGGSTN